jgi:hypothetical protein
MERIMLYYFSTPVIFYSLRDFFLSIHYKRTIMTIGSLKEIPPICSNSSGTFESFTD